MERRSFLAWVSNFISKHNHKVYFSLFYAVIRRVNKEVSHWRNRINEIGERRILKKRTFVPQIMTCCFTFFFRNKLCNTLLKNHFSLERCWITFRMVILRNKNKIAAVNIDRHEGCPGNNLLREIIVLKLNEEYITQVSKEIEGRVVTRVAPKFNRTESRIQGPFSKLDEFRLNSQIRLESAIALVNSPDVDRQNQKQNEDPSQNDPHPEVGTTVNRSPHAVNSDFISFSYGDRSPEKIPFCTFREMIKQVKEIAFLSAAAIPQWKQPWRLKKKTNFVTFCSFLKKILVIRHLFLVNNNFCA